MSRLLEIYEGWKNLAFPDVNVEIEAKRRIGICVNCAYLTKKNYCQICGCYMPAKVRSMKSKCRLKRW